MKTLRDAVSVLGLTLLAAGYAASQAAAFDGTVADYSARVDSPAVQRLSLLFFLVLVALALVRDRPTPSDPS
ncbi:MAG: hypothetical protein KIS66_17485 [Fimbriimonadaceae bacterium]|nr:hypothetical protein [Fimbriimonadaceae bacterium]